MKSAWIAAALLMSANGCLADAPSNARFPNPAAYAEMEVAAEWQSLAASHVRQARKANTLYLDPAWNARVDTVVSAIGAAAASLYPRFANTSWRAILIDDFGHGAVAFPDGTLLVDAKFMRRLDVTDDELALVVAHEVAHVVADHLSERLSFMAQYLGKDKVPTAHSALMEFIAQDSYAVMFEPTARLQEREADAIGAVILCASGYDARRALELFDKLTQLDPSQGALNGSTHDTATARRRAVFEVIEGLQRPPAHGPVRTAVTAN